MHARFALGAVVLAAAIAESQGFIIAGAPPLVNPKLGRLVRPRGGRGLFGLRAQVQDAAIKATSPDVLTGGPKGNLQPPINPQSPHELSVQQKLYMWLSA